jgi:hypothetical protein
MDTRRLVKSTMDLDRLNCMAPVGWRVDMAMIIASPRKEGIGNFDFLNKRPFGD